MANKRRKGIILAGGADGYPAGDVVERFADMDGEGRLHATADHLYGRVVSKTQDFDEAMRWFRKAADQGHEKAKTHLADLQKKQGGSQAVGASLTGTPEEWSRKGDDYYDAKNYSEALRLYLAAAEKGVTKNYNRIGYMYRNGEGRLYKSRLLVS